MSEGVSMRKVLHSLAGVAIASSLMLGGAPAAMAEDGDGPADAVAPTAVAAAKKKLPKSVTAYAKGVNAYAKKKAGGAATKKNTWPGGTFKSSKKQKWYISPVTGQRGYALGNSPSQRTVDKYRKAVVRKLKRDGFTQIGSVKSSSALEYTRVFRGARFACSVDFKAGGRYGSSPFAGFSCVTRARVKAAEKKARPFVKAYSSKKRSVKNAKFVLQKGAITSSAAKKFKKYKKASVGVVPVMNVDGFSGQFAKAPGKKWRYVAGVQAAQKCSVYERSTTFRRAFAYEPCYRGGGLSRVTPK